MKHLAVCFLIVLLTDCASNNARTDTGNASQAPGQEVYWVVPILARLDSVTTDVDVRGIWGSIVKGADSLTLQSIAFRIAEHKIVDREQKYIPLIWLLLVRDQRYHSSVGVSCDLLPFLIEAIDNDIEMRKTNPDFPNLGSVALACFELATGDKFSTRIQEGKGTLSDLKSELMRWWENSKHECTWDSNLSRFNLD